MSKLNLEWGSYVAKNNFASADLPDFIYFFTNLHYFLMLYTGFTSGKNSGFSWRWMPLLFTLEPHNRFPFLDIRLQNLWPPLVHNVLRIFHRNVQSPSTSSRTSPLTPLMDNPFFPFGLRTEASLILDKSFWPQFRHHVTWFFNIIPITTGTPREFQRSLVFLFSITKLLLLHLT